MTDEEIVTSSTEDYTPPPAPDPAPEPEAPAAPVEVITVDDLLDRLTGAGRDEEPFQETEEEADPWDEFLFNGGEPIEVIGMDTALKRLEIIQQTIQRTVDHPALTTPFEDYTVTEALLLLLSLSVFVAACVKMLKGGFAWLR